MRYLNAHDLKSDAQATSTSGHYRIILAGHFREGLPCFDVLAYRIRDDRVTRYEWWAKEESEETANFTYDQTVQHAAKQARDFYEQLVAEMQEKPVAEETSEHKGITIYAPDGTEEKYELN